MVLVTKSCYSLSVLRARTPPRAMRRNVVLSRSQASHGAVLESRSDEGAPTLTARDPEASSRQGRVALSITHDELRARLSCSDQEEELRCHTLFRARLSA